MEDFERIQVREHQRQGLLEELKRIIRSKIKEEGDGHENFSEYHFYWGLAMCSVFYLDSLRLELRGEVNTVVYTSSSNLFHNSLLPGIKAFSSVMAEKNFIVAELLRYVVKEMVLPAHQEILRLSVPPDREQFLKDIGLDTLE